MIVNLFLINFIQLVREEFHYKLHELNKYNNIKVYLNWQGKIIFIKHFLEKVFKIIRTLMYLITLSQKYFFGTNLFSLLHT